MTKKYYKDLKKFRMDYLDNEKYDDIDVDATIEALREAWKCAPDMSLSQLLDEIMPMPFCEMKNAEIIEELNQFILQNHKQ